MSNPRLIKESLVKNILLLEIPEGEYKATWNGYVVYFMVGMEKYAITSLDGIRGEYNDGKVIVVDGGIEFVR